MDRVVLGKRFCLLLFCFALSVWIGYTVGEKLPQVRMVLMPQEAVVYSGSLWQLFGVVSARLRNVARVLAIWYFVSLVSMGNRAVAKVGFPLLSACRGCLLGLCLTMVDVLGDPWPGLVCYFVTTVLLIGFAAGERAVGFSRTTGRFLTHAGAVFAMTLVLGVI